MHCPWSERRWEVHLRYFLQAVGNSILYVTVWFFIYMVIHNISENLQYKKVLP